MITFLAGPPCFHAWSQNDDVFKIVSPKPGFIADSASANVVVLVPMGLYEQLVEKVELKVDNVFAPEDKTDKPAEKSLDGATYILNWDATKLSPGDHTLKVYVKFIDGHLYRKTVDVKVVKPPVINVKKPAPDSLVVRSRVKFEVEITSGIEPKELVLQVDGVATQYGIEKGPENIRFLTVDTYRLDDGRHNARINVLVVNGQSWSASLGFTLAPPWVVYSNKRKKLDLAVQGEELPKDSQGDNPYSSHVKLVNRFHEQVDALLSRCQTSEPHGEVDENGVAVTLERKLFRSCETSPAGDQALAQLFLCRLITNLINRYDRWRVEDAPNEITGRTDNHWFVYDSANDSRGQLENDPLNDEINKVLWWIVGNSDEQTESSLSGIAGLLKVYPASLQAARDYTQQVMRKIVEYQVQERKRKNEQKWWENVLEWRRAAERWQSEVGMECWQKAQEIADETSRPSSAPPARQFSDAQASPQWETPSEGEIRLAWIRQRKLLLEQHAKQFLEESINMPETTNGQFVRREVPYLILPIDPPTEFVREYTQWWNSPEGRQARAFSDSQNDLYLLSQGILPPGSLLVLRCETLPRRTGKLITRLLTERRIWRIPF